MRLYADLSSACTASQPVVPYGMWDLPYRAAYFAPLRRYWSSDLENACIKDDRTVDAFPVRFFISASCAFMSPATCSSMEMADAYGMSLKSFPSISRTAAVAADLLVLAMIASNVTKVGSGIPLR